MEFKWVKGKWQTAKGHVCKTMHQQNMRPYSVHYYSETHSIVRQGVSGRSEGSVAITDVINRKSVFRKGKVCMKHKYWKGKSHKTTLWPGRWTWIAESGKMDPLKLDFEIVFENFALKIGQVIDQVMNRFPSGLLCIPHTPQEKERSKCHTACLTQQSWSFFLKIRLNAIRNWCLDKVSVYVRMSVCVQVCPVTRAASHSWVWGLILWN